MESGTITPPPGFELESAGQITPPPGFVLETAPQPAAQPRTFIDSLSDVGSELWKKIDPVAGIQGLADAAAHPIEAGGNLLSAQGGLALKVKEAFKKGNYVEAARHAASYMVPVLGPGIDEQGDRMDKGEYAKALGGTLGIGANIAAPELIKGVRLNMRAKALSERLYQSALKPSTTLKPSQVERIVDTGLKERIVVSPGGAEKLANLVEDLNDKIKTTIGSGQGKAINKYSVTSRLGDTAKKFATQVNPEADLSAIAQSEIEFLRNQPGKMIPAKEAQALKQGTYAQLKGKAYGELKSAAIESQKALARGIKEELNQVFPELAGLNARESGLFGLEPVLTRAVQRTSNHQLIGLGTPLVGGVAKAVTRSNKLALATGAVKAIIDSPNVKSRLAIALHRAGKAKGVTLSAAAARVAAYSVALGQASASANSETPDDLASQ